MARIEVKNVHTLRPGPSVWVDLDHITDDQVALIRGDLDSRLAKLIPSQAVAEAFVFGVELCPSANASDIWQHVIYRSILAKGVSDQQWKRIAGFALERAFVQVYNPRLLPLGIRIRVCSPAEFRKIIAAIKLTGVRAEKLDLLIEVEKGNNWNLMGGAHVKSSIAERIQDDAPASVALMNKGLVSIFATLDSKSFPPPHGDGVNYGELGGRSWDTRFNPRLKRQYIEEDGQFDALFSYNLRTPPSPDITISGKRIHTLSFFGPQPDAFVQLLEQRADAFR